MATGRSRRVELQHLTVYGYIRRTLKDIPDDLKDICFQFYLRVFDKWDIDKSNDKLDADVDEGVIEAKCDNGEASFFNAFGTIIVKKGDIEKWKIKPLTAISCTATFVGIVESSKASKDWDVPFAAKKFRAGIAYDGDSEGMIFDGLNGNSDALIDQGWQYPQQIVLTLDMSVDDADRKNGHVLLKRGDAKETTIYNKIDMNKQYRLAVAFLLSPNCDHHKIQLISD